MATSNFFGFDPTFSEQRLVEDLTIESIRIHGVDVYYLPRTLTSFDDVLNESAIKEYNHAVLIEMYLNTADGFTGDGTFLSKLGLEIRDKATMTIAKRVFDDEIGALFSLIRPREGDLVYFPLNGKCFEIRYVDNKPFFYQLGNLPTYEITVELFEYSGEIFNTGIKEIDSLQVLHSFNLYDHAILTETGECIYTEASEVLMNESFNEDIISPSADNEEIETEADTFVDFSEKNPFSDTTY